LPIAHSQNWLDQTSRFSNIEINLTDHLILELITGGSSMSFNHSQAKANSLHILSQQTLCPRDSKFFSWDWEKSHYEETIDSSFIVNLMYRAIHENQHKPARAEALARRKYPTKNVGNFDYECDPDTKFIVFSITSGRGFGMNFRSESVEPLLFSLLMNRVAVYIQPKGEKFHYADCPRNDMQCFFMPLSPCVLTHQDLQHSVQLTQEEIENFRVTGNYSLYDHMKVLVVHTSNAYRHPSGLHEAFFKRIAELYHREAENQHIQPSVSQHTLKKVHDFITDPRNQWLPWTAAQMYALRPNEFLNKHLRQIFDKSVPTHFNATNAIGVAIRDGDKCQRESQCMPFDNYMQLALEVSIKRSNQLLASNKTSEDLTGDQKNLYKFLVLTSDSKQMMDQRFRYNESFQFEFIVNSNDIGQGHGRPRSYSNKDTVMIDTIAALKLQLMPETLIINSCSNFHRLIESFYWGCGGGGGNGGYLETLKENDNPSFRMKCAWG
jgi:hypothetical protein